MVPPKQRVTASTSFLAFAVLVFAAVVLIGEGWLFVYKEKMISLDAFRLIALTLVVTAGVLLAILDTAPEKTTPAFALIAAVAGYAFGKGSDPPGSK